MSTENKESTAITANNVPDMDFLKSLDSGALDSLGQKDIIMPRYRLIQNTSKSGTPGKWVSNLSPENELDELVLVILHISNYRTYFPPKGENNDKPLCRSNDGYTKSDPLGIGDGNCDTCRYAQWAKGQKPPCFAGYTILGLIINPDGVEPCMVSLKGSAIKVCRSFFTRMKTKGISSLAYKVHIRSESVVNDKGRFFLPVFEFGDYLTKPEILYASEQAKIYRQYISNDAMADVHNDDEGPTHNASAANDFLNSLSNVNEAKEASAPNSGDTDSSLNF